MNVPYALVCALFSVIGSFLGTLVIHYVMMKTNRKSIRILPLAFVLALCTILLPLYSFFEFYLGNQPRDEIFKFNSLC
jgi:uncharacterized membrane protein YfcA